MKTDKSAKLCCSGLFEIITLSVYTITIIRIREM